MQILSLSQALAQAGIYNSDGEMEQDMKFASWISKRSYRIIDSEDYAIQQSNAADDGVEVFIIGDRK